MIPGIEWYSWDMTGATWIVCIFKLYAVCLWEEGGRNYYNYMYLFYRPWSFWFLFLTNNIIIMVSLNNLPLTLISIIVYHPCIILILGAGTAGQASAPPLEKMDEISGYSNVNFSSGKTISCPCKLFSTINVLRPKLHPIHVHLYIEYIS